MPTSPSPLLIPVLLCGGSGSRLWPLSRELHPKPFVQLSTGETLFTSALKRVNQLARTSSPIIVTNEEHRFYVLESLDNNDADCQIILEPAPRNTAPAIYLAALAALERCGEDALMLVCPADHYFDNSEQFTAIVGEVSSEARKGRIITFGIIPTRPESAYGYIQADGKSRGICKEVTRFIEKPPVARAKEMLESGGHYWNSGIFLMQPSVLIEEMSKFRPDIARACEAAWKSKTKDDKFIRPDPELFLSSPEDSIDYAIMEHTGRALMAPLDCGWNDMGSWEAFYQTGRRDERGNVCVGDVLLDDVSNSYICARGRLVAAIGMSDVAIVDSGDAVLVLPRNRSQEVKDIVKRLKAESREEAKLHPVVYRPWGSYERLSRGDRFQVKRIIVKPGASLSLQMHHHRSEHWIIVRGTAEITVDAEKRLVSENQSIYIPVGHLHKLYNPGRIPLELIEVQSGPYLGEDDIVRIEDSYGRE